MTVLPYHLALIACLGLEGCAGPADAVSSAFRDPQLTVQAAQDVVRAGTSTKADVAAALGKAKDITFDSGFEVWVYRPTSRGPTDAKAEFVILFTPAGVVQKTRVRPGASAF